MTKKELKDYLVERIKKYMENYCYESAPSLSDLIDYFKSEYEETNEEKLKDTIIETLKEIGKEKEEEGYTLEWNNDLNEYDDQVFVVAKYPNERDLTEKEQEFMKEYLIRTVGINKYWNLVDATYGFSFKTDGDLVWVDGDRERCDGQVWTWDEILSEISEGR